MKKLALIVLLAVVASRILAEHDDRDGRNPVRPFSIVSAIFDDEPPAPPRPLPPPPPRAVESAWHGSDLDPADEPPAPRRGPRSPRGSSRKSAPAENSLAASRSKVMPAWFPRSERDEEEMAQANDAGSRVLVGRPSVSEERARADLRKTVKREIADWLAADIPTDWALPDKLVDRMVQGSYVQTVTRSFGPKSTDTHAQAPSADPAPLTDLDDLYTLYRAGQKLDFSDSRRADFIKRYHRDVASNRMRRSGSVVAVVLASLALVSLYIRTDEATKGYYTNRLRMLALAGLGGAGALAYRYWA